jgi:transcriptional regulator with XRE-family HTH domain
VRLPLIPGAGRARKRKWPTTEEGLYRAFLRLPEGGRLTHAEVARRAGTSLVTIGRIRRGDRRPSFKMGLKVAAALGKNPWWLAEYIDRIRTLRKKGRKKDHVLEKGRSYSEPY